MVGTIRKVIAPLKLIRGKNFDKLIIKSDLEIREFTSSNFETGDLYVEYGLIGTDWLFTYDNNRLIGMTPIDNDILTEEQWKSFGRKERQVKKKIYGEDYVEPDDAHKAKVVFSNPGKDISMQFCIQDHFDKKDSKETYINLNHLLKKLSNMNNRSKAAYVLVYVGSYKSIEYEEFKALKHIRRGLKWLIKRKLVEETLAGSISITDAGIEFVKENITHDQFELIKAEIDSIVAYEEFGQ
jgi:hypothetical protein